MKLISVNIELNKHYETVLPFLKKEQATVVCIQELLEEAVPFFEQELNLPCIHKSFQRVGDYPHLPGLKGKKQGVAIFSKNIIDSGFVFYYGTQENVDKPEGEYFANNDFSKNSVLVWADIADKDGKVFKFITTHLPVTHHGESSIYQLEVVEKLISSLKGIGDLVLCGDMNAPRGKETFACLERNYKDNIPLEYETSLDKNLHRVRSIPEEAQVAFTFMVDVLFTTPVYKATNVKLVDGVSDHMAIVAEIEKN